MKCSLVSTTSTRSFKDKFLGVPKERGAFILMFCSSEPVKRRRTTDTRYPRGLSATYKVRLDDEKVIPVCRDVFCAVLGVSHNTVTRLLKYNHGKGEMKPQNRGSDYKVRKYGHKRAAAVSFIKRLRARESHYCRQKTKKLYLPSELKSIRNVWRMYNAKAPNNAQVKYGFFHGIFRTKFNLSFGTPRTDVCSVCLRNAHYLKTVSDPVQKQGVITEERVHNLKYKAFYALLRERRANLMTLSFDFQQSQAILHQQAYYSRQLYQYHFCIVRNQEDGSMPKDGVHCYTWSEDESAKGSNEVVSALHSTLRILSYEGTQEIRLVADGCAGQNKNSTMIGMLLWRLQNEAPAQVSKITPVFPVTGHSFLSPDRVFGRIEKEIRKHEKTQTPTKNFCGTWYTLGGRKALGCLRLEGLRNAGTEAHIEPAL